MSCLFNSFSRLLGEAPQAIRNRICDYLEAGEPIMEGIPTKMILDSDRPNYIAQMRNPSVWGGAIEIQAACNIWKAKVIVENRRDSVRAGAGAGTAAPAQPIEFVPVSAPVTKIMRIYWTGGHYEPISVVAA
jgi:hypothetical protein